MTRLKDLRKERKLTQIELSKLTGISQNQISRYEKGQHMHEEHILTFSKIFKVTADYFIYGSEKKN